MLKISGPGKLPTRASEHSCGYDVYAYLDEPVVIPKGGRAMISTGIQLEIDTEEECYIRIAPRSGLALKSGIDVLAGVVDKDYRGTVQVILMNNDSTNYFVVNSGDKIAQLIIEKCCIYPLTRVEELNQTQRADKGFGSSDK